MPDHPNVDRLPDDRAQRHRDRRRLRVGAGRAAGGGLQAEAGRQDSAARLHLHAAPRTSNLARPFRILPLCRRAQVGLVDEESELSSIIITLNSCLRQVQVGEKMYKNAKMFYDCMNFTE